MIQETRPKQFLTDDVMVWAEGLNDSLILVGFESLNDNLECKSKILEPVAILI